ncbi:hypothetical protein FQN54_001583 [Arachnomyces sp. PD_36]|nr:hypothetical protein FQN54_001583 [Arachnomyces sp. PD_36]
MPPQINEFSDSDSDTSAGTSIPFRGGNEDEKNDVMGIGRESPTALQGERGADNEDDEDEGEEEDVYVVERVVGHEFGKNGSLLLQVKWKGYDKPEDQTMEPEENLLEGAKDILEKYYKKQGGRPVKPKPARAAGKKRKSLPEPKAKKETPKKRGKRNENVDDSSDEAQAQNPYSWIPRSKVWDDEVDIVETILRDKDGDLYAYINWRNGKKSKLSIAVCYERCPQKMLQFYERHLTFKDESAG